MKQLPEQGEYFLKTRLEERLVHYFTPFLEAHGYTWQIEAADEYGVEDGAKFIYKK